MNSIENRLTQIEKSIQELADKTDMEQYLTSDEVSKRLSVSKTLLWMWDKEGILKPSRIGKKLVRYKLSDIKSLMSDI